MKAEEKIALINGLREFAELLEANPHLQMTTTGNFLVRVGSYGEGQGVSLPAIREWAAALGTYKRAQDGFSFSLERKFGGLSVHVYTDRDGVCQKVKRMKQVEVEEWDCPPSLLDPEAGKAEIESTLAAGEKP